MLPRTLEPEVMDTVEDADDYDAMDHSEVNRRFVDDLLAALGESPPSRPLRVLDTGTGTALIPIELRRRSDCFHVTAVDLAEQMLAVADRNVRGAGFEKAISLELVDSKSLPYNDDSFDVVMSNSIVHHIPEPSSALAEMSRVLRPGGLYFLRDLMRPAVEATVEQLVAVHARHENPHQRQLFRQSLHAALTVDEVRALLESIDIDPGCCTATSDRHWTIAWSKPT